MYDGDSSGCTSGGSSGVGDSPRAEYGASGRPVCGFQRLTRAPVTVLCGPDMSCWLNSRGAGGSGDEHDEWELAWLLFSRRDSAAARCRCRSCLTTTTWCSFPPRTPFVSRGCTLPPAARVLLHRFLNADAPLLSFILRSIRPRSAAAATLRAVGLAALARVRAAAAAGRPAAAQLGPAGPRRSSSRRPSWRRRRVGRRSRRRRRWSGRASSGWAAAATCSAAFLAPCRRARPRWCCLAKIATRLTIRARAAAPATTLWVSTRLRRASCRLAARSTRRSPQLSSSSSRTGRGAAHRRRRLQVRIHKDPCLSVCAVMIPQVNPCC